MSRYSSNVLLCLAVFGGSELKDTCSVRKQNVQMIPNNRKRRYGRLSRNALAAMLLLPVVPVTGVWNIYVRRCLYSIPLWSTCVFGLVFFTFKKAGAKIPRKRPWFWWKMQTFNVVFLKTIKRHLCTFTTQPKIYVSLLVLTILFAITKCRWNGISVIEKV